MSVNQSSTLVKWLLRSNKNNLNYCGEQLFSAVNLLSSAHIIQLHSLLYLLYKTSMCVCVCVWCCHCAAEK